MDLPKITSANQKGELGLTILKKKVEQEFKWLFRKNHQEHDFGIDCFFDIITNNGGLTGKTLSVQLKTGKSYFDEKNEFGWVFRESMSILNYFSNHELPILIIILDDVTEEAYFVKFDLDATESAGKNWKITIPFDNKLESNKKDILLNIVGPLRNYSEQVKNYWQINKEIEESGQIILNVDKFYIDQFTFKDFESVFRFFTKTNKRIENCREKIEIFIDGYNDDPRELKEIAEVQNWVNQIFSKVNGLSYFLNKNDYSQFLKLFILINIPHTDSGEVLISESGRKQRKVEFDSEQAVSVMEYLFGDLNEFYENHKFTESIHKEISGNIIKLIAGELPPDF